MEITKEALAYIANLGHDASGLESVHIPLIEKVAVRDGESYSLHDLVPERRRVEVHGLDDMARLVKLGANQAEVYHEGCESPADMKPGQIYDGGAVRALLDRNDRRDVAELRLRPSDLFMQIIALSRMSTMSIPQAVNTLRMQLPIDGIVGAGGLVGKLRQVNFKTTEEAGVETKHGRESMSLSIAREVEQAAAIPETIDVSVPIYCNDQELRELSTVSIKLGVYLDTEKKGVCIQPLGDEIDSASADVQVRLGQVLRQKLGEGTPVFHGCPKPEGFMNPVSFATGGGGGCG